MPTGTMFTGAMFTGAMFTGAVATFLATARFNVFKHQQSLMLGKVSDHPCRCG